MDDGLKRGLVHVLQAILSAKSGESLWTLDLQDATASGLVHSARLLLPAVERIETEEERAAKVRKYGLPTFPIVSGMYLGQRDPDELEWLATHGSLQSDLYRYLKIVRTPGGYQLLRQEQDTHQEQAEQLVGTATNLQTLLELYQLDIAMWHWYAE